MSGTRHLLARYLPSVWRLGDKSLCITFVVLPGVYSFASPKAMWMSTLNFPVPGAQLEKPRQPFPK